MNDFMGSGTNGEEREPTPQTQTDTKPADDDMQAALRTRIKALGPDAIVEIARGPNSAHMPQKQVRQFRDGLLPIDQDKLAALAAAVSTAEAARSRKAKTSTAATGEALKADGEPPTTFETPETADTAPEGSCAATSEAPAATGGAPTASTITIVNAIGPPFVGKTFALVNGKLTKTKVVASIWKGEGRMVDVPTAKDMLAVLATVTQSGNQALVLDAFKNGKINRRFSIVTEDKLEHLLGNVPVGDEGIYDVEGVRIAARLKRGVRPSCWLLLDADNPEGMPPEWTILSLEQRLKMLEPILPGVSACERIEYLSSSARVVKTGGAEGPRLVTHALARVSHPEKIETLHAYLGIATVNAGLAFKSPRHSKREPEEVIGHAWRTLFDLAPIDDGRLSVRGNTPSADRLPRACCRNEDRQSRRRGPEHRLD